VAFPSFARRLHDILAEADGDPAARPYTDALIATVNDAASRLGVAAGASGLDRPSDSGSHRSNAGRQVGRPHPRRPASRRLAAGNHLRQIEKVVR
jgi:hypothetical protein